MQHSEIQERVPLYALGGMSASESAQVAQHLAVCPSCRALLNEYQFIGDELLAQVPLQTAPAYLGVRLQNIIQTDARQTRPRTAAPNGTTPAAKQPRFWDQPLSFPRWALALTALVILLLAGVAGVSAFRLQAESVAQRQVMQLLTTNQIKYIELTDTAGDPRYGFLCVTQDNTAGLLWLHDLAPLDPTHVYQVWLRNGSLRDNGGTFRGDWDGRAMILIQAPHPLTTYTEIGITVEPAAGSQGPTTPRIIGGKLD